ncbi:hypothetical protein BH18VER2_BH18VER2_16720 [soil metagenome]
MRIAVRGGDEAELPRAAADVDDPRPGGGHEQPRRLVGDPHRRPLQRGQLPDRGGINLIKFLVFDRANLFCRQVLGEFLHGLLPIRAALVHARARSSAFKDFCCPGGGVSVG